MSKDFNHLHVHSHYSLLDGANKIEWLVEAAKQHGQKAIALTDHGNMFGALKLFNECKKNDIKPIVGCEFYVAANRFSKHTRKNGYNHITLLARTQQGYKNLLKLTSMSYIEGLSWKPRVDMELLKRYSEGVTCLSGCLSGRINELILAGDQRSAEDMTSTLRDIYGKEHFWLELQRNGLKIQDKANEGLVEISNRLDIPLIATNDIHYHRHEDCDFQDTILCISTNAKKGDVERFRFDTDHLYTKTTEEMASVFKDLPDTLRQTAIAAEQIDIDIPQGHFIFPEFDTKSMTPAEMLKYETVLGIKKRYAVVTKEIQDRAEYELKIIESMGFPTYFLVVQDFVRFSKQSGIPVGPGRGSAAGSIIAYALGITDIDPIKYKLLFSRFLNENRSSLPDIDIDFCQARRPEIINYLKDKHGDDRVSQVMTFSTYKPKVAIRDSARAYDLPYVESDTISKKMTGDTIKECIAKDVTLTIDQRQNPEIFKTAFKLEGMVRHAGTHASGILIGSGPLYETIPLARAKVRGESVIISQWDLDDCEAVGLVKFDILGLETLTVIERCQALIEERHGARIDLLAINKEDDRLFEILSKGDTEGIFQCYSDGMKSLLSQLKPDKFEDVIAAIALYRPGPLESGITDSFIARKHGKEDITYVHPDAKKYLLDTYGTIVYQEQIMQISMELAGFSMSEADDLRKAVGKKDMELLNKVGTSFLEGTLKEGKIDQDSASKLWNEILKYGRYCFNLSHSVSYAYLTAYTLYLKCYYPVEFFTANLSQEADNTEKLKAFIYDTEKHGIKLLPPDIRKSKVDFSIVDDKTILIGLSAIKGLGSGILNYLMNTKLPDSDDLVTVLTDFPANLLKKNFLNHMASAGLFDFTGIDRGMISGKAEEIITRVRNSKKAPIASLWGDDVGFNEIEIEYYEEDKWETPERLREERRVFGFYVSGHPMRDYKAAVYKSGAKPIAWLGDNGFDKKNYTVAGVITDIDIKAIKNGKNKGKKFARIILEDEKEQITCMLFSKKYEELGNLIKTVEEKTIPVMCEGKLDKVGDIPQMIINKISIIHNAGNSETFDIELDPYMLPDIESIHALCEANKGTTLLSFLVKGKEKIIIETNSSVNLTNEFIEELEKLI
jgi:DNA polymerase III subunit alpha